MNNILFVLKDNSYLMPSFREQLEKLDYEIITVPCDIDAINAVKDPVSGVLIFADEKTVEQASPLTFLKDWATANSVPIFALGPPGDLEELKQIIPERLIQLEFLRPLDILLSDMVKQIDGFIQKNSARMTILAVDDSGAILRAAKAGLGNKYSLFLVNSGAMAIKYLAQNRPDMVLLDYDLPAIDGGQIFELIRSESQFADVPVVFLTPKQNKKAAMNVRGIKPDGFLAKSLEPAAIMTAIDDLFERIKAGTSTWP
jgi:CheY-like chemotaxis protein